VKPSSAAIWLLLFAFPSIPRASATTAVEYSPERGMRISNQALATLGVTTTPVIAGEPPKQALVHTLDRVAVYRLRDGWFKLVPPTELKPGDRIAVQGVGLLRVAEMQAGERAE
jgi:hypothetical protein